MTERNQDDPLHPIIEAWINEAWINEAGTNNPLMIEDPRAAPLSERDRDIVALISTGDRSSEDMSNEEAGRILVSVRSEVGRRVEPPLTGRDAWLAVAAILCGVAIGLLTSPIRDAGSSPHSDHSSPGVTVKRVFFESVREGKAVRFQLELKRVR